MVEKGAVTAVANKEEDAVPAGREGEDASPYGAAAIRADTILMPAIYRSTFTQPVSV